MQIVICMKYQTLFSEEKWKIELSIDFAQRLLKMKHPHVL